MPVRDFMSKNPITIHAQDDYISACKIMEYHAIRHLPVLDDHEHLVGIVANQDIQVAANRYLQCAVEVDEIMHRDVITATPDMPLDEAALLMAKHHIGALPVVNGRDTVVGIITKSDVFRVIHERITSSPDRRPFPALAPWSAVEKRSGERRLG